MSLSPSICHPRRRQREVPPHETVISTIFFVFFVHIWCNSSPVIIPTRVSSSQTRTYVPPSTISNPTKRWLINRAESYKRRCLITCVSWCTDMYIDLYSPLTLSDVLAPSRRRACNTTKEKGLGCVDDDNAATRCMGSNIVSTAGDSEEVQGSEQRIVRNSAAPSQTTIPAGQPHDRLVMLNQARKRD